MPAGRPPKPIGTAQGHRKRRSVALMKSDRHRRIPRPPAGLLQINRKRWRAYWLSNLAQAVDRQVDLPRIERWIGVLDEYERLNDVFKQTRLVRGSTGQPALNPLAGYLVSLLAELRAAETELGMTPLARQRLGIMYGQARMTAYELNRMLNERTDPPREVEAWQSQWIEA